MAITLLVSVVACSAAYPLAYFLAFVAGKPPLHGADGVLAPFFTSYLLRVIAWQVILNNNGVINCALWQLGLRPHGDGISWLIYSKFSVAWCCSTPGCRSWPLPIFVVLDNMDRSAARGRLRPGRRAFTAFLRVTFRSASRA